MNLTERSTAASRILKWIVVLAAAAGIFLSAYAGRHSFMGGRHVFMFFTIQSNIAIAVICLIGLLLLKNNTMPGRAWYIVQFAGTVSITLTGMVFCFILAPVLKGSAWNIQNVLTHVVVPVAAVADFFLSGRHGNLRKMDVLYVILPPLAYVIYAGIGYMAGWEFVEGVHYPYFFLNWGSPAGAIGFTKELPYMGCVWWILFLLLFLLLVGAIYLLILKRLERGQN